MRRVAGLLFAAILLLSLTTVAPAMGLFPGTHGFPSFFGGNYGSSCSDPGSWCCPSVYVGYGFQGSKALVYGAGGEVNLGAVAPLVIGNRLDTTVSDPGGVWVGVGQDCQVAPQARNNGFGVVPVSE